MDRKKLETRLLEWSSDFGFTLPNGLPPPANYFSILTLSPKCFQLWESILNKVQPRDKVEFIRKQIFLSKLKSSKGKIKSKDFFLQAVHNATDDKLELWKKKEMLEREIKEKKTDIEGLESLIEKKSLLIQSEICKMAEARKQCMEYKMKTTILKLSVKKYERLLENHLKLLTKIKECRNVYEFNGHGNDGEDNLKKLAMQINKEINCSCEETQDCKLQQLVNKICQNENVAWETVLRYKSRIIEDFSKSEMEKWTKEDERLNKEKKQLVSVKAASEKIMLDITEKSLLVMLNEQEEKSLDGKIREFYKKLSSIEPDDSCSFLGMNASYDVEENEISKLKVGLNYIGLKKRLEYLKSELERINKECEKKKIFSEERREIIRKLSESNNNLNDLYERLDTLATQDEVSEDRIKEEYSNLKSAITEIKVKISDSNYVEQVKRDTSGLENSVEEYGRIFLDTNLDAFRKIQGPLGREILEIESLPDSLNNYGGELKDLFSTLSISPYEPVENIITSVRERKKFSATIAELISKRESLIPEQRLALKDVSSDFDYTVVEKNNKEIDKILMKALNRLEHTPEAMELIEKLLNAWYEQSFRHMIPDTKKQNDLTYRQYESQYQKSLDVLKYYSRKT